MRKSINGAHGAGTLVPDIKKSGTEVPAPEGYKQTKVGVIPEDWSEVKLSDISEFITKGTTPTTFGFSWVEKGIPFLRSECVSENGLNLKAAMQISKEANQFMNRSEVRVGDILITITGNVGRTVLLKEPFTAGNINQHIARIRIHNATDIDARFVNYFLSQEKYRNYYQKITTGQAYPQISLSQVRESIIPLPIQEEQQKIAEILSTWDDAIAKLETLIAQKIRYKKGVMQKLLSGEMRFNAFGVGTLVPESPCGTEVPAPEGWETVRLGDAFEFLRTYSNSRNDLSDEGDIAYIHYGDIHTKFTHHLNLAKQALPKIQATKLNKSIEYLKSGDLIIADASEDYADIAKSIELVDIGDRKVIAGLHTMALRDTKGVFADTYKGYMLYEKSISKAIKKRATGISVLGISKANLSSVDLFCPPIEEQQKIAEVLTLADNEIEALKNELYALKEQKKGLMQQLLTGKVRVNKCV